MHSSIVLVVGVLIVVSARRLCAERRWTKIGVLGSSIRLGSSFLSHAEMPIIKATARLNNFANFMGHNVYVITFVKVVINNNYDTSFSWIGGKKSPHPLK